LEAALKKIAISLGMLLVLLMPLRGMFLSNLGIKGGLNATNFRFSVDIGEEWKDIWNPQIGVFYRFKLSKWLAFQPELYYIVKGAKVEGTFLGEKITQTEKFEYLEIPLLLKTNFSIQDNIWIGAYLGGYGAWNFSAKSVYEYRDEVIKEKIKDEIKNFEYGLTFGGSMELWKLILDVRYSLGLSDIKATSFSDFTVKNSTIAVLIGYRL
jgi:hypothetical protein